MGLLIVKINEKNDKKNSQPDSFNRIGRSIIG
jgi:hypothetical protein